MHEVAHLFVTFLALEYAKDLDAITPDGGKITPNMRPEAGVLLERVMFGGSFVRVNDASDRSYKFMVRFRSRFCIVTDANTIDWNTRNCNRTRCSWNNTR
jgi:hypothetical protein